MNARNATPLAADYFKLNGQVALVTGASSGIGLHLARTLGTAGCIVGIAARRQDRLVALAEEIDAGPGEAVVLQMDVTDRASVDKGLDRLAEAGGCPAILVNNAGVALPSSFLDAKDEETGQVFALNQIAAWRVAQSVCRRQKEAGTGGSIINIASITGLRTVGGAASYAVSKAALVQMTKVMALELARYGIRVNALAPGYFATELNRDFLESDAGQAMLKRSPMRRAGRLEELDAVTLLLASERGSFITGAVIPVDGGHLVSGL